MILTPAEMLALGIGLGTLAGAVIALMWAVFGNRRDKAP